MRIRTKFVIRGISMYQGGGEMVALNLAKELEKLDVEVSFITGKPLIGRIKYRITEFPVNYCMSPYLRDFSQKLEMFPFPIRQIGYMLYKFDSWAFSTKVIDLLRRQRADYDILQLFSLPLIVKIKERINVPIVEWFPGPPSLRYRDLIQQYDLVTATYDVIDVIQKEFRRDAIAIPPGVDSDLFRLVDNSSIIEKYSLARKKVILFVGRFVPLKNLSFLIATFKEALRIRRDLVLFLVGEGPVEEILKKQIRKYGIDEFVIFAGRVPNRNLPSYYSAADLFVLSSSYESFPIVILEAMSCELPVVATRVGGIPMQVKDGENGFLVESGNIKQLKEAIITLLDDDSLAKEMGKRNRELVKRKYSWATSAQKLKEVYESILK